MHYHPIPTLRTPPLSIISTLDLQIIAGNWRLQPSICDKFGPINIEPAANSLSMRSWDRKVCRLLMQQEDIAMCWRSSSWRCRTKVRRGARGCRGKNRSPVLHCARWGVVLQERVQDSYRAAVLVAVDICSFLVSHSRRRHRSASTDHCHDVLSRKCRVGEADDWRSLRHWLRLVLVLPPHVFFLHTRFPNNNSGAYILCPVVHVQCCVGGGRKPIRRRLSKRLRSQEQRRCNGGKLHHRGCRS